MNKNNVIAYLLISTFLLFSATVFAVTPSNAETRYSAMGTDTPAGLGGALPDGLSRIVRVTNLNASGEGSLAWALGLARPRVVVFEVGGVIDLAGQSITVTQPFLTVAGQSAPAPGITLIRGGLNIRTHDVRVQHIRVRPGDNLQPKRSGWESDGISVAGENAKDVHIDHVSVSWAVDENLSASGNRYKGYGQTAERVTFSNNLIAEALDYASHKKGKHSKGLLVHDYVRDVAVVRNLFVSNDRRNPYFKAHTIGFVANNIIYNAGNAAIQVNYIEREWEGQSTGPANARVAVVNNQLVYGRDTYSDLALVSVRGDAYLTGNSVTNLMGEPMPITEGAVNSLASAPSWLTGYELWDADEMREHLVASVGATPWARDAIDTRIINGVATGKARIIDSQQDVGGYPSYKQTNKKFDIPDDKIAEWLLGYL